MNIELNCKKSNQIAFKGFEARKLQAIVTNGCYGDKVLLKELDAIAKQNGILLLNTNKGRTPWAQDGTIISSDGRIFGEDLPQKVFRDLKGLDIQDDGLLFDKGGNYFQVKNKVGEKILLSGFYNQMFENSDECLNEDGLRHSEVITKKLFGCDRLVEIPQADFHIDLFLTPIGDNKILLCDDELTIEYIKLMINRAKAYILDESNDINLRTKVEKVLERLEVLLQKFTLNLCFMRSKGVLEDFQKLSSLSDVEKALSDEGFEVIKVPGRIFNYVNNGERFSLNHDLNYSNAITFKNSNDETVIITNKSLLNQEMGITSEISKILGMDFEKMFLDSVKDYVKPENIFFLEGKSLPWGLRNLHGGLHCLSLEVPDFSS